MAAEIKIFVVPFNTTEEQEVQVTQDNQVIEFKTTRLFQLRAENTECDMSGMSIRVRGYGIGCGGTCDPSFFHPPSSLCLLLW